MKDLQAAAAAVAATLALPEPAAALLVALGRLDLDPSFAQDLAQRDEHGRAGVMSWRIVLESSAGAERAATLATAALRRWGLVRVVGEQPGDVEVPGSSPLRLTFWGRAALGLGPDERVRQGIPGVATPWLVLHGASRERLRREAVETLGAGVSLVRAPTEPERLAWLCGEVALACVCGGVIVDATGLTGPAAETLVDGLLTRTASARAGRALLLTEAAAARWGAARSGATLRWIVGDGGSSLDEALTARLLTQGEGLSPADVSGVPASSLAWPRRVDVPLTALELPAPVSRRLHLALHHAQARVSAPWERRGGYRLLLSGLPGTGKTLTASAFATVLNRPMARIDLSSVLSKWLGETEQRLGEIFDLSEATGAVLVLDEAESLFRQRDSGPGPGGGLSTAVGFLLSRLDEFRGALIATTNRATDLDEAFFRRFDDYLVLPMPDVPTRERLWRRGLGDPPDLDWALLSERFMLSGGLIDGACRRALAWASEAPLSTPLVLGSLALELEKNQQSASAVYACVYGDAVRTWLGEER